MGAIIAILNYIDIAELTLLTKYRSGCCKRESMAKSGGKNLEAEHRVKLESVRKFELDTQQMIERIGLLQFYSVAFGM